MMRNTLFFFAAFFFCSVALATNKRRTPVKDTIQHITLDTLEVKAPPGLPPYQPSSPLLWEIKNTRIALTFDWMAKTANAREWINMKPNCFATDTIELDAKSIKISKVILSGGKKSTSLPYTCKNDKLKIQLPRQYTSLESVQLYLEYTAMPYAEVTGGSAAITDDRGLYFINSDKKVPYKPSEIWTQGETESNSHWMVTIDKPNTRFTTQIELTVPDGITTLSNGAMVHRLKAGKGMHTDVWKMNKPIQAYAVMFAIGKFSEIKDRWNGKEVNYYVEPEFAPHARKMFARTKEMMAYFSKRTGVTYPWNKYSQVAVRDYVSGAMENTSASLFGEFVNLTSRELEDKNNDDVVSHELFHQWFGDYVTCESWSNITVNESFANYGEQLWRIHQYGRANAEELGWDDLNKYLYAAQLKDPQLVRFHYDNREEVFDGISYNKGGAILHYLNTMIGDAAFDKAMKIYLTRNALHSAEAHNWRMAVEEATGQDWNWFFNQWYYHAGHPDIKVKYIYDDSNATLKVAVSQIQDDSTFNYTLPLKTMIIYGQEKNIIDWNIRKHTDTLTYPYKNGVRPVLVPDYLHVLPGKLKDNKKPAQWLEQYNHSDGFVSKLLALTAAARELDDSIAQIIMDKALADTLPSIRKYALDFLSNKLSDKVHIKWTAAVQKLAASDKDRHVRAYAMDVLGNWKIEESKPLLTRAVADRSYLVAGNALEALNKMDSNAGYTLARKILTTRPGGILKTAAWAILGQHSADSDIVFYEQRAPFEQGNKKFFFAFSLSNYLKHRKSDDAYNKGIDIYGRLIITESTKSYKTALMGYLFQIAADAKSNLKSDDKDIAASAPKRLAVVKATLEKIIGAETDNATIERWKKSMKDTFEPEE